MAHRLHPCAVFLSSSILFYQKAEFLVGAESSGFGANMINMSTICLD
jgi:hypothetical protein